MRNKRDRPQTATWDKKNMALENAFRKLRIKRFEESTGIPYDFLIPGMGRELLLMTPISRPKTLPPKKALRNLVQAADRMVEAMDSLPKPVLEALNFKPVALRQLKIKLRVLHWAAKMAVVKADKGAPQKVHPAKIALVVARNYHGLTGEKPTVPKRGGKAYGPFLGLLKTVFEILDVKASPESQGNEIAKNWESLVSTF